LGTISDISLQSLISTQIVVIAVILVFGLAANYFYNFLMSRLLKAFRSGSG
jgi:hypothetical protein